MHKKSILLLTSLGTLALSLATPVVAQGECIPESVGLHAPLNCLQAEIATLDRELNRAYQQALSKLPEEPHYDYRKGKLQLRKAQRAWLQFKTENCALVGGQEGGQDNSWVTFFALECERDALKERIGYLKALGPSEE